MSRLRDYQAAAVEHVVRALNAGTQNVYFTLPTGGGKTRVLGALAEQYANHGRTLTLVHRGELAEQIRACYADVYSLRCGTIAGGVVTDGDAPHVVAIVDSLTPQRMAAYLAGDNVALVLVDEAHHAIEESRYDRLIAQAREANPDLRVVGCTATPTRADHQRMSEVSGRCVFARDIEDLVELGVLARLRAVDVKLSRLDLCAIARSAGEYAQNALGRAMVDNANPLVKKTSPHLRDVLSLVFAANVAHATALVDGYRAAGVPADVVLGSTPAADRAERIARWRERGHGALVNVAVLTEGFDEPRIGAIVIAAPTQSPVRYCQMVGRGLRLAPGKTECVVIDVRPAKVDPRQVVLNSVLLPGLGGGETFGVVARSGRSDPFGGDRRQNRNAWLPLPNGAGYILGVADGTYWHAARVESGLWNARLVRYGCTIVRFAELPLPELAERIHERIAEGGSNPLVLREARWRAEPPSPSQRALAARLRVKVEAGDTAGDVSDAITLAYASREVA